MEIKYEVFTNPEGRKISNVKVNGALKKACEVFAYRNPNHATEVYNRVSGKEPNAIEAAELNKIYQEVLAEERKQNESRFGIRYHKSESEGIFGRISEGNDSYRFRVQTQDIIYNLSEEKKTELNKYGVNEKGFGEYVIQRATSFAKKEMKNLGTNGVSVRIKRDILDKLFEQYVAVKKTRYDIESEDSTTKIINFDKKGLEGITKEIAQKKAARLSYKKESFVEKIYNQVLDFADAFGVTALYRMAKDRFTKLKDADELSVMQEVGRASTEWRQEPNWDYNEVLVDLEGRVKDKDEDVFNDIFSGKGVKPVRKASTKKESDRNLYNRLYEEVKQEAAEEQAKVLPGNEPVIQVEPEPEMIENNDGEWGEFGADGSKQANQEVRDGIKEAVKPASDYASKH